METQQKTNNKKWFSLLIIFLSVFSFIFITSKFMRVVSLLILCIALWKNKEEEPKTVNMIWFILTIIMSLVYLSVAVDEAWFGALVMISAAITTIIIIILGSSFLIGVLIAIFTKKLTGGKEVLKLILPYLGLSALIILVFGAIYFVSIHSDNPEDKLFEEISTSSQISFSSYYSSNLITTPDNTWVKITYVLEKIISYVVHIIILGIAVSRVKRN